MEQLRHTIESYIEQAKLISKEYPKVNRIAFDLEVDWLLMEAIAFEQGEKAEIRYNIGTYIYTKKASDNCYVMIRMETKRLIVEQIVTTEE